MAQERAAEGEKKVRKPKRTEAPDKRRASGSAAEIQGLAGLQQKVGNQAVQRLVVQRRAQGPFRLDENTAERINRERGGGQPLDEGSQQREKASLRRDLGDVRVHTSPEADDLSRQLGAKAFTTGKDVFFREGAYNPGSKDGQELISHEMTHVVQQAEGRVRSGGGMTVTGAGDVHEREANAVAQDITPAAGSSLQRQAEEEEVQMQPEEEEEVQMQPEEEEEIQMQEEEEEVQMQEEEEELQMQAADEEEEGALA